MLEYGDFSKCKSTLTFSADSDLHSVGRILDQILFLRVPFKRNFLNGFGGDRRPGTPTLLLPAVRGDLVSGVHRPPSLPSSESWGGGNEEGIWGRRGSMAEGEGGRKRSPPPIQILKFSSYGDRGQEQGNRVVRGGVTLFHFLE